MKFTFALVLAVVGIMVIHEVHAHDVFATIVNKTPFTYHLTNSRVRWGDVKGLPAILLSPYSSTNFSLSSPVVGIDEIEYKFGYTPEEEWCSTISPPLQLNGEYKYTFGSNSCDGDFQPCAADSNNLTLSYVKCGGRVTTSRPIYTITYEAPPPPPSPSPTPTPTTVAPTPPPTPVSYVYDQSVQQKIDCGVGGTQYTMLASSYPPAASLNDNIIIQIGGDPSNPASASGSAIHDQEWFFALPPGFKVVSPPQVDNRGTQGTMISGGGTLEPISVSESNGLVTMIASGKCSNGSVFVPPGFNITLAAVASGTQAVTMNNSPAYTCKAIVSVKCTGISPLTSLTSTIVN